MHETEKTIWHHGNAGTAAEMVKVKQIAIWEALRAAGCGEDKVRTSIQMCDELIFAVQYGVLEQV
jgi:DNA polymerase I-like protein with 3'-5' exonuclease and polymerase domains